jgi:hypothetical protein
MLDGSVLITMLRWLAFVEALEHAPAERVNPSAQSS